MQLIRESCQKAGFRSRCKNLARKQQEGGFHKGVGFRATEGRVLRALLSFQQCVALEGYSAERLSWVQTPDQGQWCKSFSTMVTTRMAPLVHKKIFSLVSEFCYLTSQCLRFLICKMDKTICVHIVGPFSIAQDWAVINSFSPIDRATKHSIEIRVWKSCIRI